MYVAMPTTIQQFVLAMTHTRILLQPTLPGKCLQHLATPLWRSALVPWVFEHKLYNPVRKTCAFYSLIPDLYNTCKNELLHIHKSYVL